MAALGTTSYIENITHQTQHRPFSIHHTIVQPNVPCALYLHCHSEMEFFYLEKGKVTLQVHYAVSTTSATTIVSFYGS